MYRPDGKGPINKGVVVLEEEGAVEKMKGVYCGKSLEQLRNTRK